MAEQRGVKRESIVIDPGIGFGKSQEQNLELIAKLDQIIAAFPDFPLLIGTSRKSFLGRILADDERQPRARRRTPSRQPRHYDRRHPERRPHRPRPRHTGCCRDNRGRSFGSLVRWLRSRARVTSSIDEMSAQLFCKYYFFKDSRR